MEEDYFIEEIFLVNFNTKNIWPITVEEQCKLLGKACKELKLISANRQRWYVAEVDALYSI